MIFTSPFPQAETLVVSRSQKMWGPGLPYQLRPPSGGGQDQVWSPEYRCRKRSEGAFLQRNFEILLIYIGEVWGLPRWLSDKESAWQHRRCKSHRFNPWVRKIPWRKAWQPTPVFLPGKSHGQRSLAGYSLWGHKELDMTW